MRSRWGRLWIPETDSIGDRRWVESFLGPVFRRRMVRVQLKTYLEDLKMCPSLRQQQFEERKTSLIHWSARDVDGSI